MHIADTDDEEPYRCGVHGKQFWANLTVGPGTCYVTLKFAGTPLHTFLEKDKSGGRITHTMDVLINGTKVVNEMNVAKAAGGLFRAFDRMFTNVNPRNGIMEIRFLGCDEQGTMVQSIEIGPMSECPGQ